MKRRSFFQSIIAATALAAASTFGLEVKAVAPRWKSAMPVLWQKWNKMKPDGGFQEVQYAYSHHHPDDLTAEQLKEAERLGDEISRKGMSAVWK